jgi:hypothetical protein
MIHYPPVYIGRSHTTRSHFRGILFYALVLTVVGVWYAEKIMPILDQLKAVVLPSGVRF